MILFFHFFIVVQRFRNKKSKNFWRLTIRERVVRTRLRRFQNGGNHSWKFYQLQQSYFRKLRWDGIRWKRTVLESKVFPSILNALWFKLRSTRYNNNERFIRSNKAISYLTIKFINNSWINIKPYKKSFIQYI